MLFNDACLAKDVYLAMEEFGKWYEKQPFFEKLKTNKYFSELKMRTSAYAVTYNGYVACKEKFSINVGDGKYYVYLWKHCIGEIFYVGSGTGERWRSKFGRNDAFYSEIDKGDAVVYKVIDGIDMHTARAIERYISLSCGLGGAQLANKDNNIAKTGIDKAKEEVLRGRTGAMKDLFEKAEDLILNKILLDSNLTKEQMMAMYSFNSIYGNGFFSSNLNR